MPLFIESRYTGGQKIQVAENDFPDKMNWKDAMSACAGLGNGWRLPTREELLEMKWRLYKEGKGNFKNNSIYWSSSQDNSSGQIWCVLFDDGNVDHLIYNYPCISFTNPKNLDRQVRAVRAF